MDPQQRLAQTMQNETHSRPVMKRSADGVWRVIQQPASNAPLSAPAPKPADEHESSAKASAGPDTRR